jgi:hypothetical protein
MLDTSTLERKMERTRHISAGADPGSKQAPEGTHSRPDDERPAPPPATEAERERPAEPEDIVHEASDDSFPASDPPAWIDVWH